jgi:2-iminobutanoate/2-iminopropanoate deaminase
MAKEVITVPTKPKSPLSPGIKAGDYIFVSGQVGTVDDKGREVKGIEAQTRQCLENMKLVLETAGSSLSDVVKVTVFLVTVDDFAKMNEVYQSYFPKDYPARSTVITGLVRPSMLVEIECVAYHP